MTKMALVVADDELSAEDMLEEYGSDIEKKLEAVSNRMTSLVKIAGRWFPRGLLVDVSEGQLNLAEAVLDVATGRAAAASGTAKGCGAATPASIPSWQSFH